MASINRPSIESTEEVNVEDSIDDSDDDCSIVETILETQLLRIESSKGKGKCLKVASGRVYEWNEVVEVVTKFVEMIDSYPAMIRSLENEPLSRAWQMWISTNYKELNFMDTHFMVASWTREETMRISFDQFPDMEDSAPPPWDDEIVFLITKTSRVKSLKEIGIEAVAKNLKNVRDVGELKLPSSLSEDLKHGMSYYCEKFPVATLKDLAAAAVVDTLDKVEDVAKLDISESVLLKLFQTGWRSKFKKDLLSDSDSDEDEYFLNDESDEGSDSIYSFDSVLSALNGSGWWEGYYANYDSDST